MQIERGLITFLAVLWVTTSGLPAAESDPARKPLRQMTCADFLGYEDAAKPEIVYWAAIHDRSGRLVADPVDVDETDRIVPVIIGKCKTAPGDRLWQTVRSEADSIGGQSLQEQRSSVRGY
jgi:hypothetical protein